jgi:hypothetical protein
MRQAIVGHRLIVQQGKVSLKYLLSFVMFLGAIHQTSHCRASHQHRGYQDSAWCHSCQRSIPRRPGGAYRSCLLSTSWATWGNITLEALPKNVRQEPKKPLPACFESRSRAKSGRRHDLSSFMKMSHLILPCLYRLKHASFKTRYEHFDFDYFQEEHNEVPILLTTSPIPILNPDYSLSCGLVQNPTCLQS